MRQIKEAEENTIHSDGSRFEILEKMDSFCSQFLMLTQEELEHLNSSITRALIVLASLTAEHGAWAQ